MDKERHQKGKYSLSDYKVEREHTFAEFVQAGMEISMTIGIDCSPSIKLASHHLSPHYTAKGSSTYETAMLSLSAFLLNYTSNSSASVYAIGAKAKHPKVYMERRCSSASPSTETCASSRAKLVYEERRPRISKSTSRRSWPPSPKGDIDSLFLSKKTVIEGIKLLQQLSSN